MNRWSRWSAVLAVSLALAPAARADGSLAEPVKLRYDPQFILEAVARRMSVTLRPEILAPPILLESATPLQRFQEAMVAQWGFAPHVFANAYSIATNEIYLIDDPDYYARLGRTPDDSLAHEFAHYLQVRYLGADLADQAAEIEAIAVQQGFQQEYVHPKRAAAGP